MFLQILIGLLAIVLGAVFLLIGYRAFLALLPVGGFVAGFILGAELMATVLNQGFLATLTGWIVGIVAGIFVALISYFVFSFGVIFLSAFFGLALGAGIVTALNIDSGLISAIAVTGGAVLGIGLAIFLDIKKYLVIAITAFGGAAAAVTGLLLVFNRFSLEDFQSGSLIVRDVVTSSFFWVLIWIALGVAGIVIQVITTRGFMIESEMGYIGRPDDVPG
jgi:hypothetical protein